MALLRRGIVLVRLRPLLRRRLRVSESNLLHSKKREPIQVVAQGDGFDSMKSPVLVAFFEKLREETF